MKETEKIDPEAPILRKHHDGTVWREGNCACGNKMYKKNLTTNTMEFLIRKNGPGNQKTQTIQQEGDNTHIRLTCPECGKGHIISNIKESVGSSEEMTFKIETESE